MMNRENVGGFWENWDRHRPHLFRKCLNLVGDADEAEDALSTAMLRAFDKSTGHTTPNILNFKAWTLRLTENICIDILRKRNKMDVYDETIEANMAGKMSHFAQYHESAENRMQREEIILKIYDAMEQLPERLRETAILRLFMKMPYHDIAVQLHVTEETVRKRLQQARTLLDRKLKGFVGKSTLSLLDSLSTEKSEGYSDSPIWVKIKEKAEKILNPQEPEITFTATATRVVKVALPSGRKQVIPVFLKSKPIRQEIKIKTLQDYIARYPGGWKKRMELAEIQYAMGEWDQAVSEFRQVVEKHPQNLTARLLLGRMLMNMGEEKEAVKVYKTALSYVSNQSSKCFLAGMMAMCKNQVEAAAAALRKAAAMEPRNEIFFQNLALSLLQANRPKEALEAFEAALAINPRDLVSLTYSYEPLLALGRLEKAEEYIDRILDIYPSDILALERKVELRCRKGLVRGEEGKITRRLVRQLNQLTPKMASLFETKKPLSQKIHKTESRDVFKMEKVNVKSLKMEVKQ